MKTNNNGDTQDLFQVRAQSGEAFVDINLPDGPKTKYGTLLSKITDALHIDNINDFQCIHMGKKIKNDQSDTTIGALGIEDQNRIFILRRLPGGGDIYFHVSLIDGS